MLEVIMTKISGKTSRHEASTSDDLRLSSNQDSSHQPPKSFKTEESNQDLGSCLSDPNAENYCVPSHPNINLCLYVLSYIIFMIFGACLFAIIEQPTEVKLREELLREELAFLAQNQCVDVESFKSLVHFLNTAKDQGIDIEDFTTKSFSQEAVLSILDKAKQQVENLNSANQISNRKDEKNPSGYGSRIQQSLDSSTNALIVSDTVEPTNWEFTSSFIFVTSLVTTIGYGHITPLTNLGKSTSIIFSVIGVPATLTLLSTFVTLLLRGPITKFEFLLAKYLSRLHCVSLFFIQLVHLILTTTLLILLCFILPATLFHMTEPNWSFLDALYYCYISLTTIGLGDFVPATFAEPTFSQQLYRMGIVVYLYVGLILVMLWLAIVYRIPQLSLNKLLVAKASKESHFYSSESLRLKHNSDSDTKHANYGAVIVPKIP